MPAPVNACEICGVKCTGVMTDRRIVINEETGDRSELAVERFCCKNHIPMLFNIIKKGQENFHECNNRNRLASD